MSIHAPQIIFNNVIERPKRNVISTVLKAGLGIITAIAAILTIYYILVELNRL